MQSKGAIKLLAVLLALACIYQLSFTFKTRSVEKKAAEYAAQFPVGQQSEAEQHYLDSVQNVGVYNLGFKKFTYKECKEKELNLGLDLKGGMNVMLEVQVEDVIKALAGDSQNDPAFVEAIAEANAALKEGTSKDYISDFVKAYQRLSNGGSLAAVFVSPDRKDITLESSDADVEKILKRETDAAIAASFNVLRSRIDHFGVTQPNIMRLPNSHRILVELPGVKEPQRVRDLLQGTASLEFWLTYDAREVLPALAAADKFIKAELSEAPAAQEPEVASVEAAAAAGTPAGEAEGLLAEIGSDTTAVAEAEHTDRYDRAKNPLFAVLDPGFAGGAAIGAAYKADMAAVNEYLANPAVRELFPADIAFKWGVKGDDKIIVWTSKNQYYITGYDLGQHFPDETVRVSRYEADRIYSVCYYDRSQQYYYMKRFTAEMSDKIQDFLDADADFICVTDRAGAKLEITYKGAHASRPADVIDVDEFVGVKSHRAKGKRLTTYDVDRLRMIEPELPPEPEPSEDESLDDGQLTDASADAAQRAAAEGKASEKSALKEPLGAKPAPGKASAGQPSAGTIVGGVEFEVERPKGDAGEMIDPEQLNLF